MIQDIGLGSVQVGFRKIPSGLQHVEDEEGTVWIQLLHPVATLA